MYVTRLSVWGCFLGPPRNCPVSWADCDSLTRARLERYMSPQVGATGSLPGTASWAPGWSRLRIICGKAYSGKQRGRIVGSPRRAWNTERHWAFQRCFSFSVGDRAGSFLGWLCAVKGWTVQPRLNQRHCVQMNKCTLFWDAAIVFGVGGKRGLYFVCVHGSMCFWKVSADCNSCCSVFVCQTEPSSWERGMWRIPAQDYINQSIISPGMRSTNDSKS